MKRMLLIAIVAIVAMTTTTPTFAGIQDWPEANPQVAFNATENQRLWHRAGNLVLTAKSWPIVRATITIYTDQLASKEAPEGILTLTHMDPEFGTQVSFYFNIKKLTDEPRSVLSFRVDPGMWEEAFLGLIPPLKRTPRPLSLPEGARSLWLLPPALGHLTKAGEDYTLNLISGGEGLSGLITLPLGKVDEFLYVQNGRTVRIWGMEILPPSSVKWSSRDEKQYEWKPGDPPTPPKSRPRLKEVSM